MSSWQNTGWELTEGVLQRLITRLDEIHPRVVVELGSGRSTIAIGKWAKKNKAKFVSLEHQERFARQTRRKCSGLGVDLRCVPLVDGFYQTKLPGFIDFVLIDGPPGLHGDGRLKTFPSLWPHLSNNFEVWLDDADREHEQSAVDAWSGEYPISVEIDRGVAVISPILA